MGSLISTLFPLPTSIIKLNSLKDLNIRTDKFTFYSVNPFLFLRLPKFYCQGASVGRAFASHAGDRGSISVAADLSHSNR